MEHGDTRLITSLLAIIGFPMVGLSHETIPKTIGVYFIIIGIAGFILFPR